MTEEQIQSQPVPQPPGAPAPEPESEEVIEGHAWLAFFIAVGLVASGTWWYYGENASVSSSENDAATMIAVQKRDPQTRELASQGVSDDVSAIENDLDRSNLENLDRELDTISELLMQE